MITEFRERIYKLLEHPVTEAGYQINRYLPDDVNMLPCVTVGRVRLSFQGTQLGVERTLVVYVIGSRLTSDDSQQDLDSVTEQVLSWLFEADVGLVGVEPVVQTINANVHPAYEITVLAGNLTNREKGS